MPVLRFCNAFHPTAFEDICYISIKLLFTSGCTSRVKSEVEKGVPSTKFEPCYCALIGLANAAPHSQLSLKEMPGAL